jgi:hypothetical protein
VKIPVEHLVDGPEPRSNAVDGELVRCDPPVVRKRRGDPRQGGEEADRGVDRRSHDPRPVGVRKGLDRPSAVADEVLEREQDEHEGPGHERQHRDPEVARAQSHRAILAED